MGVSSLVSVEPTLAVPPSQPIFSEAALHHPWWPHLFSFPRFLDPVSWLWLSIKGYAFSSSGEQITIVVAIFAWWRHRTCAQPRCLRLGHAHPDHGRPVCRRHFHHDVKPPAQNGGDR